MDIPLKDIMNVYGECIKKWQFIDDNTNYSRWRIYYSPFECNSICNTHCVQKHGFYFSAVERVSNSSSEPMWGPDTTIQVLYDGCAYFDGLRHVYAGSEQTDNYGYFYYPDATMHATIWTELSKIEDLYCDDY